MRLFAALLIAAITGWSSASADDASPESVARSLIYAMQRICVPYVVDGAAIDELVNRPGISTGGGEVNGVFVRSYSIDAPGHPVVTPGKSKALGIGLDGRRVVTSASCWVAVRGSPAPARQVIHLFRDGLFLPGYETKRPHDVPMLGVLRTPDGPTYVMCVRGFRNALIFINNPDAKAQPGYSADHDGFIEVHVEGDPGVAESEDCTWYPVE